MEPCRCDFPTGFAFHSCTETTQTWIHTKCGGYVVKPMYPDKEDRSMSRLDSRQKTHQTTLPEVDDNVTAGDWWLYGTMIIGLICMGIVALIQSL